MMALEIDGVYKGARAKISKLFSDVLAVACTAASLPSHLDFAALWSIVKYPSLRQEILINEPLR